MHLNHSATHVYHLFYSLLFGLIMLVLEIGIHLWVWEILRNFLEWKRKVFIYSEEDGEINKQEPSKKLGYGSRSTQPLMA